MLRLVDEILLLVVGEILAEAVAKPYTALVAPAARFFFLFVPAHGRQ